ncbi:DNA repair protein rad5 [Histoplasma capsulatum H143]|uniref:DNA repair protein rad5 n=1 Tax=Ajellomyces capsulatus (strain H143) TaxID=544712 RepID=C6HKQ0_AJECH|nr:DNA repair protein rad5 [Histoplasma capsulatum H143]
MATHGVACADIERPSKKRRFFVEDDSAVPSNEATQAMDALSERAKSVHSARSPTPGVLNSEASSLTAHDTTRLAAGTVAAAEDGFDSELFTSIVGQPVDASTVQKIRIAAKGDMQTAINLYLDGSWGGDAATQRSTVTSPVRNGTPSEPITNPHAKVPITKVEDASHDAEDNPNIITTDPEFRYIGSFGVGAWSTKSGTNLVKHGELVNIERTKLQPTMKPGRGGKPVARMSNPKSDVITRFTNGDGEEIGRLPRETAEWVSTLIDQKICRFEGVCVFAPDQIRVNETIYLQLKCFLWRGVFQQKSFTALGDDNAPPRIFEEQETAEEKALRLRQVALVKLFSEIHLEPTSVNEMMVRHKKEGLLQAAQMSEKLSERFKRTSNSTAQQSGASESSDEEDGEKLNEDQLDTLYKKAQSFDFNMPEMEPGPDFAMDLRKYQKQALYWMLGKERDAQPKREQSMHPLWEEYSWPTEDMDCQPLPRVPNREKFYVNPYSGELSLEFPVQEQNCLGGILADEMGLGKTIEMLSLIHSHKPEAVKGQFAGFDTLSGAFFNTSRPVPAPYTTLVVAPTSLLAQWESEAMKASKEGSMKVLVYYGSDKTADLGKLCSMSNPNSSPNLIITSYGVVRSEHSQLARTLLKSYTTIFAQILRLRQTCCHPVLTRNQNIVAEEEDAAIAADDANVFKDDMDLQDLIDRFTMATSSENPDGQHDPTSKFTTHALRQIQTETSGECPICTDEPMVDPAVTSCWHSACKKCLVDYVEHQRDKGQMPRCFSCRETITIRDIFEVIRHRSPNQTPGEGDLYDSAPPGSSSPAPRISLRRINPLSPTAQTSAKIHALISHLTDLPPNTKSVVFSQFTSFLDLIGPQLTRAGIPYLRFDGTMAQKARSAVLAKFTSAHFPDEEDDEDGNNKRQSKFPSSRSHVKAPPPNVLLISLRAGGVGLNLTAANQVFMMDPWWSFATEAQAIDRVHRMGQLKDVSVTRFIVKDSIEGRILRIQERKMMIAGSLGLRVGGDGGEEERRKERIEELKLLFE